MPGRSASSSTVTIRVRPVHELQSRVNVMRLEKHTFSAVYRWHESRVVREERLWEALSLCLLEVDGRQCNEERARRLAKKLALVHQREESLAKHACLRLYVQGQLAARLDPGA